jgi:hypothetical protein
MVPSLAPVEGLLLALAYINFRFFSVRGDSQKFSIIQTLLSLVIPAMASSRPFGAGTP